MKIENKYREGLVELMKSKPLDEINVVMLCDKVKSNRQTFYYHYRDISDVIESMFLKERVGYGVKVFGFENIIKPLIAYINQNKVFLVAVANSFAADKLQEFYYSYFYQKTSQLFKLTKKDEQLGLANMNDVLRYIASLLSNEMFVWTLNKLKEKQLHVQKRLTVIFYYFTDNYIHDLKGTK